VAQAESNVVVFFPGRARSSEPSGKDFSQPTAECSLVDMGLLNRPKVVDPHAALARRAAAGESEAFEAIVREFGERVRSVALRMLGDPHEADDLAQEVFISVYNHLHSFRGEARLSTWILRIARNQCLNRIKAHKRRYKGSERLGHDVRSLGALPGVAASQQAPDKAAISNETRGQIEGAIAALPPKQRWLVVLRDIEGLSYDEIAEVTSLRVGTVKSRLHRAREKLARALAPLAESTRSRRSE